MSRDATAPSAPSWPSSPASASPCWRASASSRPPGTSPRSGLTPENNGKHQLHCPQPCDFQTRPTTDNCQPATHIYLHQRANTMTNARPHHRPYRPAGIPNTHTAAAPLSPHLRPLRVQCAHWRPPPPGHTAQRERRDPPPPGDGRQTSSPAAAGRLSDRATLPGWRPATGGSTQLYRDNSARLRSQEEPISRMGVTPRGLPTLT